MKYECDRCNFSTDKRYNFKQHLERVKKCKPIKSNTSCQTQLKYLQTELNTSLACEFCNQKFAFPSGKSRHKKKCTQNPNPIVTTSSAITNNIDIEESYPPPNNIHTGSTSVTDTQIKNTHEVLLVDFIQKAFDSNDSQQQLFVESFKLYLNHNPDTEFIIDLDSVYEWIGFSRKDPAKRLLFDKFEENVHYKIFFHRSVENSQQAIGSEFRGRPSEQIMMTINCFKKFCLKADTKKADQVHDYYIKLENALHQYLEFQRNQQLILQRHNLLIENFKEKPVLYCSQIINSQQPNEEVLCKFGRSNDIANRYSGHCSEFGSNNIFFKHVFECNDNVKAERLLRQHPKIINNVVTRTINNKEHTELITMTSELTEKVIENVMKEVTKEINNNSKSKEIELEIEKEKTKQLQIQLEILKLKNNNNFS